jgi:hypothetical protein
MTDGQRTTECWRRQFVKDTLLSDRASERPTRARRPASNDPVDIEEMNGDGLDGLRRFFAMMLHAIGIAEH